MEEPTVSRPFWQSDAILLAVLMILAGAMHTWVIVHTEVAARDSIAFIHYAWQLEHEPTAKVLRNNLHPPLYPVTVLAASIPMRRLYHGPEPVLMQYSAQAASTLAGLLLIVPMFYLGKELFDRRVGFWSALLFQCLPVGSRALSDGLTEGLFLLLIATGLLVAVHAFRTGSLVLFGLMGLCAGLAYLTRPEGAVLAVAAGLALLTLRRLPDGWQPGRRRLACFAALAACAFLIGAPYMAAIGGVTNKTTGGWLFEWFTSRAHAAPLHAVFFQDWKEYQHGAQLTWGLLAFLQEAGKTFHYVAWLPTLLGLLWFRSRWRTEAGVRVMLLLCALHILVVLRVAVVAGYVSERHTLLLVLCGCPWAVATTFGSVERFAASSARLQPSGPMLGTALVAALAVSGLPGCLKGLHSNRAGHRAAGEWLVQHARAWDEIKDPFCWAKYYAGREFCTLAPVPPGEVSITYIVMDTANHHSRLPQLDEAKNLIRERNGQRRFDWPEPATGKSSTVQIYEIPASTAVARQ